MLGPFAYLSIGCMSGEAEGALQAPPIQHQLIMGTPGTWYIRMSCVITSAAAGTLNDMHTCEQDN